MIGQRLSFLCHKLSQQLSITSCFEHRDFLILSSMMSSNGSVSYLAELMKAYPALKVADDKHNSVDTKLQSMFNGGHEKLQLIVDFDNTLTRHHKDGKLTDCSWGVMENSPLLPKDYTDKTNALRAKYLPIEQDPNLSIADKIPHMEEWYKCANQLLQETGMKKEMFGEFVKTSNVEFRDHTKMMLDHLSTAQVPVLVMSAGLGDILVEVMDAFDVYHRSNTKVVSNFLSYDAEGKVIGLEGKMIHVYNKNEDAIHGSEYFQKLKGRGNVMLLGDSIGDLKMADGVEGAENILKIGFLNNMSTAQQRLPSFLEGFDIVLVDDQSMNVPIDILRKIRGLDNMPSVMSN